MAITITFLCDNNPTVRVVTIRVNGAIRETTHLPQCEIYYERAIQGFGKFVTPRKRLPN